LVKAGTAGGARRWGRFEVPDRACPAARDGVSSPAAWHEAPRLDRNELKVAHDHSKAARGARRSWNTNRVEQCGSANGFLTAHDSFYLFTPRVVVTPIQLGSGLSQLSKK
jgi:hypothetical protein